MFFPIPASSNRMRLCSGIFWKKMRFWSTTAIMRLKRRSAVRASLPRTGTRPLSLPPMFSFSSPCSATGHQRAEKSTASLEALLFSMKRRCCRSLCLSLPWRHYVNSLSPIKRPLSYAQPPNHTGNRRPSRAPCGRVD